MTDPKSPNPARHLAAVALVSGGILILVGLAAYVLFSQSGAPGLPPVQDLALSVAALTPVVVIAPLLIGYGRSLLRKE